MSVAELQKYTAVSKYSRFVEEKGRRETWEETAGRYADMLIAKYPHRAKQIVRLRDEFIVPMKVLPSMRGMQFGGQPVLNKNARLYNCWGSYVDRLSFFGQAFHILLCGGGVGYSVQDCHLRTLPCLSKARRSGRVLPKKVFKPEDSIEGWADCSHVLMTSYHERPVPGFEEWLDADVRFDLSGIRKKGSLLSYGVGRAPGPMPLAKACYRNRELLDQGLAAGLERLTDELASDIHLNNSDAVVSGGVRRSANICIFDLWSKLMRAYKTGNWREKHEQRARANISAMLVRGKVNWEAFWELFGATKEFGEPGFWWADHEDYVTNPCQPAFAPIMTDFGLKTMGDISVGSKIWTETGWATVVKKWSTGIKSVYRYRTTAGSFIGTANHRIVSEGVKIEAGEAESIDSLAGPRPIAIEHDSQLIMDGLVLGDGTVHKASNDLVLLDIGQDDASYHDSEINHLILKYRPGVGERYWEIKTSIQPNELPLTYKRAVPDRFKYADQSSICSFLRGLFSANGSVVGQGTNGRVTLKASSRVVIDDVQIMLSSVGIRSYVTVNKPAVVTFGNGKSYECKQSYDLNISADVTHFASQIGFIQPYKREKLSTIIAGKDLRVRTRPKTTFDIVSVEYLGEMEVFDITVDNEPHTYWTGGVNVSNCAEIMFYCRLMLDQDDPDLTRMLPKYDGPILDIDGKKALSGWQACNLTTQNGRLIQSPEDLYGCADAAAELGTYQAGFTDFPYLGEVSERIIRKEALLGVSIAGVMHNPKVMLDPTVLEMAAGKVRARNEETAADIKINPAARLTCIKPDGNSSSTLGSFSGCHPGKIRRGFRIAQANKQERPYQHFRSINPLACEESAWSKNKTDDVIRFCVEYDGLLEDHVTAEEFLGHVRTLQKHWVGAGTVRERCVRPGLHHNVSCTVKVREHEWEGVAKTIFDHQNEYGGVSFISAYGDRDYPQAPFTPVFTVDEMVKMYGPMGVAAGIALASGFLDGPSYHLWNYSDVALGIRTEDPDAKEFVQGIRYAADKFHDGNLQKAVYSVKDAYNYILHDNLKTAYKPVDYSLMKGENDVNFQGEISCAAGACEI